MIRKDKLVFKLNCKMGTIYTFHGLQLIVQKNNIAAKRQKGSSKNQEL